MPFIVQLKQQVDQKSYIMIGSDLEADIIVTYEKAMGKLASSLKKQAISQEPGNSTEHISWETTRLMQYQHI